MFEKGYYIVNIYLLEYGDTPFKSVAFATEGLARTYVEGILQAQALLGAEEIHCEIIFQIY